MSYLSKTLVDNERVIYQIKLHWLIFIYLALHWLLAIATIGLWLLPAIYQTLKWNNLLRALTNIRLLTKEGIISRSSSEILLRSVETVTIEQTFIGRLLNYGVINITGVGGSQVSIAWVGKPLEVKRIIENNISR